MDTDHTRDRKLCLSRAKAIARREGYDAGLTGTSMEHNPYRMIDLTVADAWDFGWADGRREYVKVANNDF